MKKSHRISLNLLDEELRSLINVSAKIFPMNQEDIDNNLNPNNYEYAKVGRAIYTWVDGSWKYIIADDAEIAWDDIQEKPTSFNPIKHNHSESEISDLDKYTKQETDNLLLGKSDKDHTHVDLHNHTNKSLLDSLTEALLDAWNGAVAHIGDMVRHITGEERTRWNSVIDKADKSYVDSELSGKSDLAHNHDGAYYKKSDVDVKLSGKSDKTHIHSDYETALSDHELRLFNIESGYSEGHFHTNINVLEKLTYTGVNPSIDLKSIEDNFLALSNKSDNGHKHVQADITDLDPTVRWDNIEDKPTEFKPTLHAHSESDIGDLDKYSKSEVDAKLAGKSDTTHNHDGRYATKTELTSGLSGKSDLGHIHAITNITNLQSTLDGKASKVHNHSISEITDLPPIPTKLSQLEIDISTGGVTIGATKPTDGSMWYEVVG